MEAKLIPLLAERRALKEKLMVFKTFMETIDLDSDNLVLEKRIKASRSLYSQFDLVQSQIERIVVGSSLEAVNLQEREIFEVIYFGVISGAEKRLNEARASPNDPIPGTSRSHTTPCLPVIQSSTCEGDLEKWLRLMQWEKCLTQETDEENIYKVVKSIEQRAKYLEKQEVAKSNASSTIRIEELEHSHATNNTELSHATNSNEHSHATNSSEHSHATNSSEHLHATNSSEHLQATNSTELLHATNSTELLHATNSSELLHATNSSELLYAMNNIELLHGMNNTELLHAMDNTELLHAMNNTELSHAMNNTELSPATNSSEHSRATNNIELSRTTSSSGYSQASNSSEDSNGAASQVVSRKCSLCQGEHMLQKCPQLMAMPFAERYESIKRLRVCFNCLNFGHNVKDCTRSKCKMCGKKHHIVLHREKSTKRALEKSLQPQPSRISQACVWSSDNECTVLSTAIVYILDDEGNKHSCRALLDVGSQAHLITEDFCNKLKLSLTPADITLSGIGDNMNPIRFKTKLRMTSGNNEFIADLSCLVLKNITDKIPNVPLSMVKVPMPAGVIPADPDFQYPDTIDLLIGAGLFWRLLCIGQYRVSPGNLVWQKTHLGWVLGGCFYWFNNKDDFM